MWSQKSAERTIDSSSPPPPQTELATEVPNNNEEAKECPPSLPGDLDVIKKFIQHDKHNDYIPLMSEKALRKKRMLFLSVGINNVKIDALVDSGALINANQWKERRKKNQTKCKPMHYE